MRRRVSGDNGRREAAERGVWMHSIRLQAWLSDDELEAWRERAIELAGEVGPEQRRELAELIAASHQQCPDCGTFPGTRREHVSWRCNECLRERSRRANARAAARRSLGG